MTNSTNRRLRIQLLIGAAPRNSDLAFYLEAALRALIFGQTRRSNLCLQAALQSL